MKQIILASGSKQRKILFETLGIEFKIIPADIDEQAVKYQDLMFRAEKIARAKAETVAKDYPNAIIISADTYCVQDKQILEKPIDLDQAKEMIKNLSGNTALAYSGWCYLDPQGRINKSGTSQTKAWFRPLSQRAIDYYVNNNPVLSWSAAFSPAYHEGIALVDKVEGSFTSFTHGLPLEEIVPLLQQSGIKV